MNTALDLAGTDREGVKLQSVPPILADERKGLDAVFGTYMGVQLVVTKDGWKLIPYSETRVPVAKRRSPKSSDSEPLKLFIMRNVRGNSDSPGNVSRGLFRFPVICSHHAFSQASQTPDSPARLACFAIHLPCARPALRSKTLPGFQECLVHKTATADHRSIREITDPAMQHLPEWDLAIIFAFKFRLLF